MNCNSPANKSSMVVLLPVFNSEKYLFKVLSSIDPDVWNEISRMLVLDNASTDNSIKVVQDFLELNRELADKIEIQSHSTNLGYGGSIGWGLNWAIIQNSEHVMILHSDDQTDWGRVSKSLADNRAGKTVVVASRFHKDASIDGYDLKRNYGNRIFKILTSIVSGIKMSDPGSAIVCFPVNALTGVNYQLFDSGYMFHPQLNLVLYSNNKLLVKEIPLNWRDASTDNRFPMLRYGLNLLRFLIKFGVYHRFLKMDANKSVKKSIKNG